MSVENLKSPTDLTLDEINILLNVSVQNCHDVE